MSLRAFGIHVLKHGRTVLQSFAKRHYYYTTRNSTIGEQEQAQAVLNSSYGRNRASIHNAVRNVGYQARRLLTAGIFRTVTNSLAADLRRKAARRLLFGESGPFLAFIGITVASNTGAVVLTEDEQCECFCLRIRNFISEMNGNKINKDHLLEQVVERTHAQAEAEEEKALSVNDLEVSGPIAKGCSAVVFAARFSGNGNGDHYPFALKMMFNYDVQSNATAILHAMYRETVPVRMPLLWPQRQMYARNRMVTVQPHPNIVAMYSVFVDQVPTHLPSAHNSFPAALPARIHPDGFGRNMSLFMLMKRYKCNLREYLNEKKPCVRTSVLLLAQLLEGVAHLEQQGVAHRDLKADNLLLDEDEDEDDGEDSNGGVPQLVIGDFGCCLADKQLGLRVPYNTAEVDKGGNAALMAPEIVNSQPGTFAVLNYTKADLWAVGAIAYEIFGQANPLYSRQVVNPKDIRLPALDDCVPALIKALVCNLLSVNPKHRLHPQVAANVCQLFLWAPTHWLKHLPTNAQILEWIFSLITKILCEIGLKPRTSSTSTEYLLIATFLSRVKLVNIKNALHWIHHNV